MLIVNVINISFTLLQTKIIDNDKNSTIMTKLLEY